MNRFLATVVFGAACVACFGAEHGIYGLYGDTPDAKHAWCVHDLNRPYPKYVATPPGQPPADAVVLFDGTQKSVDENWCGPDGTPTKWHVDTDGSFVCAPKSGRACTRRPFGDAQFHVEWMTPVGDAAKNGQLAGNSGVLPMGRYEIQILNSYDPDPTVKMERNYPDGLAGCVYAENPPLVNATRAPGVWQSYDIVFHQPVWQDGRVLHPGTVTVFHNGVLVQDAWELEGMSTHRVRRPLAPHPDRLPWSLQDHNDPVRFRNIWIRELPSRWANTTHSAMSAKAEDVTALREKTAAAVFANVDVNAATPASVNAALETLAYSTKPVYLDAAKKLCAAYDAKIRALTPDGRRAARTEIVGTLQSLWTLVRCGVVTPETFPLFTTLGSIADAQKWPCRR